MLSRTFNGASPGLSGAAPCANWKLGPGWRGMAAVTKENEENEADPSDDEGEPKSFKKKDKGKGKGDSTPPDKDDVRPLEAARQIEPRTGPGLFTIYKKGQGYWTRMGTLLAVTVLGLMLAYTL